MSLHVQPNGPASQSEGNGDDAAAAARTPSILSLDSPLFQAVQVELKVRLGLAKLSVQALLALEPGSVITLDSQLNDLVELRLNDCVVALGEIVAVGDRFGVRIVEIAPIS